MHQYTNTLNKTDALLDVSHNTSLASLLKHKYRSNCIYTNYVGHYIESSPRCPLKNLDYVLIKEARLVTLKKKSTFKNEKTPINFTISSGIG